MTTVYSNSIEIEWKQAGLMDSFTYKIKYRLYKNKQLKPDNYLLKFKRNFIKNIFKKENDNLDISSKESIYFTIARWLQLNDSIIKFIQQFKTLGHEQKQEEINKKVKTNWMQKNKRVCNPTHILLTLLIIYNQMKFKQGRRIMNICFLSLVILQPPRRTSFETSAK